MNISEFVGRFVFVRKCVGCRELMEYERNGDAFCAACREKWDRARISECKTCLRVASGCECMPKRLSESGALCLRKIFIYDREETDSVQNKLIYFLKKNNNRRAVGFISGEISQILTEPAKNIGIPPEDIILTFVPRSKKAKLNYGFDQSEIICKELSRISGTGFLPVISRKRLRTGEKSPEQKKLSAAERNREMKNAFRIRNPEIVKKCVIVFDDIVTTGASVGACADLLISAGAKYVYAVCIAYTDLKKKS